MTSIQILKRLYKDYTKKYLNKIFLAVFFSILVASSTSATAWLLDPAIDKIFLNKDQSLLILIPLAIIIAFATKGISLYMAKVLMINVAEEIKKTIQKNMLSSFIEAVGRNPAARSEVFTMTMLGFALVEAIALFALVIALVILFG